MRLIRIIVNYSAFITAPVWVPITFWYVMVASFIEGDKTLRAVATGKEWCWK
jgi:DNA/RNA endonuclease G (NUC1)